MLRIKFTKQFKRDYKLSLKRGCAPQKLVEVMELLQKQVPLPPQYLDHALSTTRKFKNARECHLSPNWLLIYQVKEETLTLRFLRTGTHSDLFE